MHSSEISFDFQNVISFNAVQSMRTSIPPQRYLPYRYRARECIYSINTNSKSKTRVSSARFSTESRTTLHSDPIQNETPHHHSNEPYSRRSTPQHTPTRTTPRPHARAERDILATTSMRRRIPAAPDSSGADALAEFARACILALSLCGLVEAVMSVSVAAELSGHDARKLQVGTDDVDVNLLETGGRVRAGLRAGTRLGGREA